MQTDDGRFKLHFSFMHIVVTEMIMNVDLGWQAESLEEMKDPEDNILKSWVEESPHPYENDAAVTKVSSVFSWYSIVLSPETNFRGCRL